MEKDMENLKDAYRKAYQIRTPVEGRKSFTVTLPYEIVEREARKKGLSIQEFLEQYVAVAQYDNFSGVFYTFELAPKGGDGNGSPQKTNS